MRKKLFTVVENPICYDEPLAKKNPFVNKPTNVMEIPKFKDVKGKLPIPVWQGHDDLVKCYYKTWSIAWKNLKKANPKAKFVENFIDTAFNGYLFMWDSSFIVMFGKYASRYFDFQKTLDNFYSHQLPDGYISRQISPYNYGSKFTRDDPVSTGPNVLPWAEWEYFLSTGNVKRLSDVFYPLCAYHNWLKNNRTWQDGTYWSSGYGCGMDNAPRLDPVYDPRISHGFISWIDACSQQYLSAQIIINMAKVLGKEDEVEPYRQEAELLKSIINDKMWDEETAFYYDKTRDGKTSGVKTVASFWTLIAGLVPKDRAERFISHLDNEKEFKRPNRVPTLSADHPSYCKEGGYWCGSVWAPTNYMVLSGLKKYGYDKLAFEIAKDYVDNVVSVFNETNTLFENYSPESAAPGNYSKKDFVGWTGLAPISVLFEYVFGIQPNEEEKKLVWKINLTDEHGVKQYPFGDCTIDLLCEKREDIGCEPVIHLTSDKPVTLQVEYNGKTKIYKNVMKI